MDQNHTFDARLSELWADFDHEMDYPKQRPKLAHYTTLKTIESILVHRELWLSNPLYMNDYQEMRAGLTLGERIFRESQDLRNACRDAVDHLSLLKSFDELFEEASNRYAMDTYIACFSCHDETVPDGLLSMWRAYSEEGSGAALILDSSKIPDPILDDSPLVIGRVHYITDEQREKWVKDKVAQLAKIISEGYDGFADLHKSADLFLSRLKAFAIFTKHQGFSEEREWRLAYLPERDPEELLKSMYGYHHGMFGIEPKLKLKLQPLAGVIQDGFDFDACIDSILCGPTVSSPLAVASFQRMLILKDREGLVGKVQRSTTPFRKTR